jgi:aminomethyltransferase
MPIAMAYVDPEVARQAADSGAGGRLAVDVRGSAEPAALVPLPFYRRPA